MKRLLIFLFVAALLVVCLVQFGYLRRSNSQLGLRLTLSERDPTLTQIIDPIYQGVFGPGSSMLSASNSATLVGDLQRALDEARPTEAVNSARRLCGLMQAVVAHAGDIQERRNRNLATPHGNLNAGDAQKATLFFSEVITRDWHTRHAELQASAAQEWARLQALEQAGDRPYVDASFLPTPAPK